MIAHRRPKQKTDPLHIPSKYSYENMMKRHTLKHASIQFRNDLLKSQARAMYQNEYDRVNSMLNNHLLNNTHPDYERLVNRRSELKKLAERALYNHEVE